MSKKPMKISPAIPKVVWVILFLILAYFLWMDHRAHVIEYLPTILLLLFIILCPLMHIFMHHGHGGKHKHHDDSDDKQQKKED